MSSFVQSKYSPPFHVLGHNKMSQHTLLGIAVRMARVTPFLQRAALLRKSIVASAADAQPVGEAKVGRSTAGAGLGGRVTGLHLRVDGAILLVALLHVICARRGRCQQQREQQPQHWTCEKKHMKRESPNRFNEWVVFLLEKAPIYEKGGGRVYAGIPKQKMEKIEA